MLRLKCKNGLQYAWDLSSARHGYETPVIPWAEYQATRIQTVIRVVNLRDYRQTVLDATMTHMDQIRELNSTWVLHIEKMLEIIKPCEKQLVACLLLSGGKYQEFKADFTEIMGRISVNA